MQYDRSLSGEGSALKRRFPIAATVISGQAVIWSTASGDGVITDATTTSLADAMGVTLEGATFSTTQSDMTGIDREMGRQAEVVYNPLAVFAANIAGSATSGAALATTAPANILVNETADTTGLIVTDDVVGTVSFAGGILVGLTGANAGQRRTLITHNNNTDVRSVVPFSSTIAVGDYFLRVPFRSGLDFIQLTTLLDEANGIIVDGTGGAACTVEVRVDTSQSSIAPAAKVFFSMRDHVFNPLS